MKIRIYLYSNDKDIINLVKAKTVREALYAYDSYLASNNVNHVRVKHGSPIKRVDVDIDETLEAIVNSYSSFEEVPKSDLAIEAVRWFTNNTESSANSLREWDAHIRVLEKYPTMDDMPEELSDWTERFLTGLTPTQWVEFIKYYKSKAVV